jgi:adenine specific DNA methylase Mod
MGLIADEQPAMYQVVQAAGLTHGKGMQSYLCMMAVRLLEMRRVLKDTGSIYLHCDPTASHYLKMLMDSIYGQASFHNEIVWKRTSGRSGAHGFGRVHDTILFYCKTETFTWNPQWLPLSEEHVRRAYRNEDERGRWQSDQLTASDLRPLLTP